MALKDSYLGLITSQHKDKPRYMAMVEALLNPFDGAIETAVYFDDAFDLDLAVGAQQDILGDLVGQRRALEFAYSKDGASVLDDTAYRVIQKAKIIRNLWSGEIGDLYEKWLTLFGAPIRVKDNQDMTMAVLLDIDESDEMQKLMKLTAHGLIVPKPMGVRMRYNFFYPDIHLRIPIHQRAECVQIVEARHCVWNLGALHYVQRDGEYRRDGTIRYGGIAPDEQYKDRQSHAAQVVMHVNAPQHAQVKHVSGVTISVDTKQPLPIRQMAAFLLDVDAHQTYTPVERIEACGGVDAHQSRDCRLVNCRDGSFCRDGSHVRKDSYVARGLYNNACTVTTIKSNGMEVTESL